MESSSAALAAITVPRLAGDGRGWRPTPAYRAELPRRSTASLPDRACVEPHRAAPRTQPDLRASECYKPQGPTSFATRTLHSDPGDPVDERPAAVVCADCTDADACPEPDERRPGAGWLPIPPAKSFPGAAVSKPRSRSRPPWIRSRLDRARRPERRPHHRTRSAHAPR